MAMFYKNICRFAQCNLEFANLYDLIQHIEETHVPVDTEKKPETQPQVACAPMSAICRYFQKLPAQPVRPIIPEPTPLQPSPNIPAAAQAAAAMVAAAAAATAKKRMPTIIGQTNPSSSGGLNALIPGANQSGQSSGSGASSILFHPPANVVPSRSSGATPASHVSEGDDESLSVGRESLSSDSSMAVEENELGTFCKMINANGSDDRRFMCTFPGCKKSYKNTNGIRYHMKIAHTHAGALEVQQNAKKFRCNCGKAYKTSHGLHNHMLQTHHRQAPQLPAPQHSPTAGLGGGMKYSGSMSMASGSSQMKRNLQLSLVSSAGNAGGSAGPKQPAQGPSSLAYYPQQSGVKSLGGGGANSSTTTLPSGVSVQVSNLGGGTTTTVQVGQQGALGVSVSSATGPTSISAQSPAYRTNFNEGRRLGGSAGHPQLHNHPQAHGGRPLKIHSGSSAGLVQGSLTTASMSTYGINISSNTVTTMGGSGGSAVDN